MVGEGGVWTFQGTEGVRGCLVFGLTVDIFLFPWICLVRGREILL